MVREGGCIEDFGEKTQGKETTLRIKRILEGNIKLDLKDVAYAAWID